MPLFQHLLIFPWAPVSPSLEWAGAASVVKAAVRIMDHGPHWASEIDILGNGFNGVLGGLLQEPEIWFQPHPSNLPGMNLIKSPDLH